MTETKNKNDKQPEEQVAEVEEQEEATADDVAEGQEEVTFTEAQQAKVDEIVSTRLAREREKWEKDNPLQGDLETTTQELESEREARKATVEQQKQAELEYIFDNMNVGLDPERRKILREFIDLSSIEDPGAPDVAAPYRPVTQKVREIYQTMPELFGERANPPFYSGGADGGARGPDPLSHERLKGMSPQEINQQWDRVQDALSQEQAAG